MVETIRLLVTAAVLLSTAAAAQPAADTADIRAAARAFDAAQVQGDRAALERLLAPDFLFVRGSGRVGNRQDFIAGFTGPGQSLQPYAVTDPLLVRAGPDVGIVGGEARVRGTEKGQPFANHFRYSDTFVRRGGRWLAIYAQITPLPPG